MMTSVRLVCVIPTALLIAVICGCALPVEDDGLTSRDPGMRVRAAADLDAPSESETLAELIATLDSDDPAARMVASGRLRRETGMDFGYEATASIQDRRRAANRWEAWYRETHLGQKMSAGVDSADEPYNPPSTDADAEAIPSP